MKTLETPKGYEAMKLVSREDHGSRVVLIFLSSDENGPSYFVALYRNSKLKSYDTPGNPFSHSSLEGAKTEIARSIEDDTRNEANGF